MAAPGRAGGAVLNGPPLVPGCRAAAGGGQPPRHLLLGRPETAEAALEPLLDRVASSSLDALLAKADVLPLQDSVTVRALPDLQARGRGGRIVGLRLPPGRRTLPSSPPPAGGHRVRGRGHGGRWLHVRIDYREYSTPSAWPRGSWSSCRSGPAAFGRRRLRAAGVAPGPGRSWRVRVVDLASGVIARSEWFEDEAPPAGATRSWPPTPPPWTPAPSAPATGKP